MTRHEFLVKLRETPRKWKFDGAGRIRCNGNCPIEQVSGVQMAVMGAIKLGLNDKDLYAIMVTADNASEYPAWDPGLRLQLRNACGLP